MNSAPIALIAKYPNDSIGEAISSFSSSEDFPNNFANVLMVSESVRVNGIAQALGTKNVEEAREALIRAMQSAIKTSLLCWVSTADAELTLAGLLANSIPGEEADLPFIAAITNSVVVAQYIRDAAVEEDKVSSIVPKSKTLRLAYIIAEASFPQDEEWFEKAGAEVKQLEGSTSDSLYNIATKIIANKGSL